MMMKLIDLIKMILQNIREIAIAYNI